MRYFKELFSGWINIMGSFLTLVSVGAYIAWGTGWEKPPDNIPPWLALLVTAGAYGFVSYRLWRKNDFLASALKASLKDRCDDVILEWQKPGEDYHNSPKKEGQALTLPNPMDPGWVSYEFKVWPHRVGLLQSSTHTLRRDLKRTNIQVESRNYSRISMAELLNALGKYKEQVLSLQC